MTVQGTSNSKSPCPPPNASGTVQSPGLHTVRVGGSIWQVPSRQGSHCMDGSGCGRGCSSSAQAWHRKQEPVHLERALLFLHDSVALCFWTAVRGAPLVCEGSTFRCDAILGVTPSVTEPHVPEILSRTSPPGCEHLQGFLCQCQPSSAPSCDVGTPVLSSLFPFILSPAEIEVAPNTVVTQGNHRYPIYLGVKNRCLSCGTSNEPALQLVVSIAWTSRMVQGVGAVL